jgi:phosphoenolpyruvate carboxykinase (ATP)
MNINHTRNMVRAAINGDLNNATFVRDPIFQVEVPTEVPGVPTEILQPRNTWADKQAYDAQAAKLAYMFAENFRYYADGVAPEVASAGPIVTGEVDTSELRFSKPGEG